MDQFTPTTVGDWIGLILFLAVVIYGLYKLFESYADSQPIYDPFVQDSNEVCSFMHIESLRRPLPAYRNMEGAARAGYPIEADNLDAVLAHMGASEQDRADIIKGTRL